MRRQHFLIIPFASVRDAAAGNGSKGEGWSPADRSAGLIAFMEIPTLYRIAGIVAIKTWRRCGAPRMPERMDCQSEAYLAIAACAGKPGAVAIVAARRRVLDLIRTELGKERRDAERPARQSLGMLWGTEIFLPLPAGQSRYRQQMRNRKRRKITVDNRSSKAILPSSTPATERRQESKGKRK